MMNLKNISALLMGLIIFVGCARTHYSTGQKFLGQHKYDKAIHSFNTFLEKRPEYPNTHTLLGKAYYKSEMYDKAISNLKIAKSLRTEDKKARLFLGMVYLRDKKIQEAIDEWNLYIEMFPSDKVSDSLEKYIAELKRGEILPKNIDLTTSAMETEIGLEGMVSERPFYDYLHSDYGQRHGFHFNGILGCD